jgi:hypothetical protein
MATGEAISQSRFGIKTEFRFGEDKLAFSLSDQTGQAKGAAFYEAIDTENSATVKLRAASACLENRRHPSGRSSFLFVEHLYQPRAARLTWAIPVRLKML